MKPIWQLTPIEFHGHLEAKASRDDSWSAGGDQAAEYLAGLPPRAPPIAFTSPKSGKSYEIIPVQVPGDFVVVEVTSRTPVGFKTGPTIAIADAHRRSGLGVELVLVAYEDDPWPLQPTLDVTEAGKKTLERAHEEAVRRAFFAGVENFRRYGLV